MTKNELYKNVSKLMSDFEAQFKSKKSFNDFKSEIDNLLKPKAGGGVVQYPMKTVDDVNYHFCRYTNYYLPESEMVMSKGKSKGYSKKAIAKWTKSGRDAKALQEVAMKLLLNKEFEAGTAKNTEAEELLNNRNKTTHYDDVRELYNDIKLDEA